MIGWYMEAAAGGRPAVPTERYGWGQLKELNAEIHTRFADTFMRDPLRIIMLFLFALFLVSLTVLPFFL